MLSNLVNVGLLLVIFCAQDLYVYYVMIINSVGIWSDVLGDIHMWRSPICWCSCHVSAESAPQWPQTGQTQQCHLL